MSRYWTVGRLTILLWLLTLAAIGGLATGAASPFIGLANASLVGMGFVVVAAIIFRFAPIRVAAESSEVFPGPPELLFDLATDIKFARQLAANPARIGLVDQTGQPGQPGSKTEAWDLDLTVTVVSSDRPRKLVTTVTDSVGGRSDLERTYTPVAEGTLLEIRIRQRMSLFTWLVRPLFKRRREAARSQASARIREYLRTVAEPGPDLSAG